MHELIEKRRLLRTPSERQRLLEEVPQVIPDLEDNNDTALLVASPDKSFQINTSVLQGASGERAVCLKSCSQEISKGANEQTVCFKSWSEENPKVKFDAAGDTPRTYAGNQGTQGSKDNAAGDRLEKHVQKQGTEVKSNAAGDTPRTYFRNQGTQGSKDNAAGNRLGMHVQKQGTEANAAGIKREVIIIDDNEDDSVHDEGASITGDLDANKSGDTRIVQHETRNTSMWYYTDPQDDEQGPFTMEQLRGWKEASFFDADFRVWRAGQSCESAILLTDALGLNL